MGQARHKKDILNKPIIVTKRRHLMNVFVPWGSALLLLSLYYYFIEFPMERSFVKGLNHLQQNNFVEASMEFDKVLAVFPKYEPVYLNMANYYRQNGRPKDSKAKYTYSKKLSVINSEIFSARGMVYAQYKYSHLDEGVTFYNNHVLKNYFSNLFYSHGKE